MTTLKAPRIELAKFSKIFKALASLLRHHYNSVEGTSLKDLTHNYSKILALSPTIVSDHMMLCKHNSYEDMLPVLWFLATRKDDLRKEIITGNPLTADLTKEVSEGIVHILTINEAKGNPERFYLKCFGLTGNFSGYVFETSLSINALMLLSYKLGYRRRSRGMQLRDKTTLIGNRFYTRMRLEDDRCHIDLGNILTPSAVSKWNRTIYKIRHNGEDCPIMKLTDCHDCERTVKSCCCGYNPDTFPATDLSIL